MLRWQDDYGCPGCKFHDRPDPLLTFFTALPEGPRAYDIAGKLTNPTNATQALTSHTSIMPEGWQRVVFLYTLLALCLIVPPRPVVEMGWSIEGIFAGFLGREVSWSGDGEGLGDREV